MIALHSVTSGQSLFPPTYLYTIVGTAQIKVRLIMSDLFSLLVRSIGIKYPVEDLSPMHRRGLQGDVRELPLDRARYRQTSSVRFFQTNHS